MDIAIKHLNPFRVAFVRHVGPYVECGSAWGHLGRELDRQGLLVENPLMIGRCFDDPQYVEASKLRFEACATISEVFVPANGVEIQWLPGGTYAATLHVGPYGEVGIIYAAIYRWCAENGWGVQPAPSLEIYLNDIHTTPAAELLTEVYVPVEKG